MEKGTGNIEMMKGLDEGPSEAGAPRTLDQAELGFVGGGDTPVDWGG